MHKYSINLFRLFSLVIAVFLLGSFAACKKKQGTSYRIDNDTQGYIEEIDNILNMSIVSIDKNNFKAEYEAGFIQGKLQKEPMVATRDNLWDSAFLTDQTPEFAKQIPPSKEEMAAAKKALIANYNYTLAYVQKTTDKKLKERIQRILYRLLGIYHGATLKNPAKLGFGEDTFPLINYFSDKELALGYETPSLTFMDVYFINGFMDLFDVLDNSHQPKCSAFVKRTDDDIFITHNSWMSFLDQSMAGSFYINGDYFSVNFAFPGLLVSSTDFGYNNKGIMFNETTHDATYTEPKTEALWMYMRAALAEQFAGSIDEFFELASLEASGTYMNGYMVVDTKTREIGLVEMSYKNFIFYKSNKEKNGYDITTKPAEGVSKEYDYGLVQPNFILGINYPASMQIRKDLKPVDNRPLRQIQFTEQIEGVKDIESAKALITYTKPNEPLSVYGRWDLGYGTTDYPRQMPDGAADAKAISAKLIAYASGVKGEFDLNSKNKAIWMKFGSAKIKGKPFIWSQSKWPKTKLREVPDSVSGDFHYLKSYIK